MMTLRFGLLASPSASHRSSRGHTHVHTPARTHASPHPQINKWTSSLLSAPPPAAACEMQIYHGLLMVTALHVLGLHAFLPESGY